MVPLPNSLNPRASEIFSQIIEIPNSSGVYLLTPEIGSPYLGWSAFLRKRLTRLLFPKVQSSNPTANLRDTLAKVEYWLTGSRLETNLLLYWLARQHHPAAYRKRLKLKDPFFVSLLAGDGLPRLATRNRIQDLALATYGPFPSRESSERYQQGALGLFQIRRCEEKLHPALDHPGCIYGEMNVCLRPCQLAVTEQEYQAEAQRLADFLQNNGSSALAALTAARNEASEQTDFEKAAHLHKELEKVKTVAGFRDSLVSNIDSLNGIAVTRTAVNNSVALWPMLAGYWQKPLFLFIAEAGEPVSLRERQMREQLSAHLETTRQEGSRAEEIALLVRWYHSSGRDGAWFPFRTLADLNGRKLVREIATICRQPATVES